MRLTYATIGLRPSSQEAKHPLDRWREFLPRPRLLRVEERQHTQPCRHHRMQPTMRHLSACKLRWTPGWFPSKTEATFLSLGKSLLLLSRRCTTGSVHRIGSGNRQRLASLDLSATVSFSIILFVFRTRCLLRQVALSTAWRPAWQYF